MTSQSDHEPCGITLMAKPEGARLCTVDEFARIYGSWADIIAWLRGADPDDLKHAEVVATVARKAALRMPRYSAYDITTWISEARTAPEPVLGDPGPVPLIDVVSSILTDLGFTCAGEYDGWLNRVTIELLYRQSNAFGANRDLLVPALLKGPVSIRYLDGARIALAHAVKLTVRAAVSGTGSSFTNLIHTDIVTARERELITESLATDLSAC